jgi:glutathione S-transferase
MGHDHPDSKLFPHATGAAEKMVQEHQKEEPLKLYSGWVFPFLLLRMQ